VSNEAVEQSALAAAQIESITTLLSKLNATVNVVNNKMTRLDTRLTKNEAGNSDLSTRLATLTEIVTSGKERPKTSKSAANPPATNSDYSTDSEDEVATDAQQSADSDIGSTATSGGSDSEKSTTTWRKNRQSKTKSPRAHAPKCKKSRTSGWGGDKSRSEKSDESDHTEDSSDTSVTTPTPKKARRAKESRELPFPEKKELPGKKLFS